MCCQKSNCRRADREMIKGLRASSIKIESTSSTMAVDGAALDHVPQPVLHVVAQMSSVSFWPSVMSREIASLRLGSSSPCTITLR